MIVADISAQFGGYWGDMTRVAHAGPPSDWADAAWDVVKEAYDDAVAATKLGNTARDVDAAQRVIVEAHPEIGACLHGAGHAIGTEIHEPPFLVATSETPLREGMIFTVEPGIYDSERGGIRLEDDILVGPDGPVNLSPARSSYASSASAAARLRAYIRRIFSREPQVCHRAPAAAAARVQEHPAAVAPRAAVQARDPGRVGEQRDGVGGDREAHAARLVARTTRGRSRRPAGGPACPAATACA